MLLVHLLLVMFTSVDAVDAAADDDEVDDDDIL